jgi:hypothetical protein
MNLSNKEEHNPLLIIDKTLYISATRVTTGAYDNPCMFTRWRSLSLICSGIVAALQVPAQPPLMQFNYSVIYVSPSPTAAVAGPFTADSNGVLYAPAPEAGPAQNGSVVAFTPSKDGGAWATTTIHSFTTAEGIGPNPGLVLGADGSLYGSLFGGGPAGSGAVLRLTPPTQAGSAS